MSTVIKEQDSKCFNPLATKSADQNSQKIWETRQSGQIALQPALFTLDVSEVAQLCLNK